MTRTEAHAQYRKIIVRAEKEGCVKATLRALDLTDLFYLLVYTLHRKDADTDFVYDRCREIEADSEGVLDLWCREHYKSSIKIQAGIIQKVLQNPNETHVIFSCTRPVAKAFLAQIKLELETNDALKELHDDVLWANPKKDAPRWSLDDGIVVKRTANPKESTLEAWGLVDGMPTSKHFNWRHYDDVVTEDMVRTEGMMAKVLKSIQLSFNLGTTPGHADWSGTHYHHADAYTSLIAQGTVRARIYGPTKDNTETGEPWIWTRELLVERIRDLGPYVASCQLFQNPIMDNLQGFKREWLRYWRADRFNGLNIYLLCDPANEKKKDNDYTVFWVVGLGTDKNYYVIRVIRDRLSLTERANVLFKLHQDYRPLSVGYEKYGMQADIQHYKDRMERDNYRFGICELGGTMPKNDRIKQLVPIFEQGRLYLPETCVYQQHDGVAVDLTKHFVDMEYLAFPYPFHDDMLDCLARIRDEKLNAVFPQGNLTDPLKYERPKDEEYDPLHFGLR